MINRFKKSLCLSVVICLLLAIGVSALTTDSVFLTRGDVNGDGTVNDADAQYLQGIHEGTYENNGNADVDGNRVAETKDLAFLQGLLEGSLPTGEDLIDHVAEFELTGVTVDQENYPCDYGITMQAAVVHGASNRAVKVWATNYAGNPTAVLTFDAPQDWSAYGSISFDTLFVNDSDVCSLSVSLLSGGKRYACSADAVGVSPAWSTTTVSLDMLSGPDMSSIQGICFTYNFADGKDTGRFDGIVQHAVYIDNLMYTPGAMRMSLWDAEALTAGSDLGTFANDGHNMIAYVKQSTGVLKSQALAIQLQEILSKTATETMTLKFSDCGFQTRESYTNDQMLWFWVDSDLSADVRMILNLDNNGFRMKGYAPNNPDDPYEIYTIVPDENGNPVAKSVIYQADDTDDADGVAGLSYVHYISTGNVNALARVKVSAGWSGWVGVPLSNYWEEKNVDGVKQPVTLADYCGAWEKLTLQFYKSNTKDSGTWVANESFYLDEFWVTDAGSLPRLSNEKLLYTGSMTLPRQTSVWNFEDHVDKIDLTGIRSARNTSRFEDVSGYGVQESVALKFWMQTEDSVTQSGDGLMTNSMTHTQTVKFADHGVDSFTVGADDDIFWFWVDADLSTPQRLLMQLNESGIVSTRAAGVTEAYIYTIVEKNGTPVIKRVDYRAKTTAADTDGVDGLDLLNGNPYSDRAGTSLIRVGADWSGWIGIPVNMLTNNVTAGTEITKFAVYLRQFEPVDGYIADQNAGDGVYLDEFWLTSAGNMPKLSSEALLYTGKDAASQRDSVQILSFADGVAEKDLSGESYIKDNTADTTYSTISFTDGKGYQGKNAVTVTMTEDNKVADWWFVDVNAMPATMATACNTPFTDLLEGTTLEDLMLWFWVDGTGLTENARLNFGIYNSGVKYVQEKQYYVDSFGNVQEMYLSVNGTGNDLLTENVRGRITVEAGTAGWIGIPASRFGTGLTALGELRFSLNKGIDRNNGNVATNIYAGDSVSIGDIWLSRKDADGNWTAPLPAKNAVTLSSEYYTAEDYLADPDLFVPAWKGQFEVPAEMLDWEEKFQQFFDPDGRTMTVGHRGDRNNLYPENSIEGFMSVIAAGVDIIEVDVSVTKDGIPVALHGSGDSSKYLPASTNLSQLREQGIAYHLPQSDLVADWTLEELRQLRLMKNGKATNYVIPTLEEVFMVAKGHVFVTLDKFHLFDWETDIVPLIEKTGAYETVMIPYNYFRNKGYDVVVSYIDQLKAMGARNVPVMTEAYETDIATITQNLTAYGLPPVLRLHEFSSGDTNYAAAYAPYVGKFRMYCETLSGTNDNAAVWAEMADMGMNIIMSNNDPYLLCQFVAQRHFADTEE